MDCHQRFQEIDGLDGLVIGKVLCGAVTAANKITKKFVTFRSTCAHEDQVLGQYHPLHVGHVYMHASLNKFPTCMPHVIQIFAARFLFLAEAV